MSFTSFFKDKKYKKEIDSELDKYGITYLEGSFKKDNLLEGRIFLCLMRAILLFLASFGTVGSLVSAFDLPYKMIPVTAIILLLCIYIAFIYYTKITFYIGYILFFIIFAISIFMSYWYVNSGFQALTNVVFEKYSDFFHLQTVREATEYITDRSLTISVMMIFTATCLAILLNISISGYMNLLLTFLITFPIVQIGLYIGCLPKLPYLMMLIAVYITVAILGRSSHYRLPDVGQKSNTLITLKKKNRHYHSYSSDGLSVITTVFYSGIFCAIFLLIATSLFYTDLSDSRSTNKLKATTDEYIIAVLQNGIMSLFDRYNSVGGLNSGMLGGVSSVRPDYETDLTVTFVPENSDNVYLKAFIGTEYSHNQFSSDILGIATNTSDVYDRYENTNPSVKNAYAIADYSPFDKTVSRMEIINVDADRTYNYAPYYSTYVSEISVGEENSLEYSTEYMTYESLISYSSDKHPSAEYENYVYDTYLKEYDDINASLDEFCDETGLTELSEKLANAETAEDKQLYTLQIALILRKTFSVDYSYTMAPGSTPRGEDFIEYFLTESKRGFCAHFAASSTMILRHLGVPARYVEGYMISLSDISDSTAVSTDISGWVDEANIADDFQTGVVQVDVTDGSAHAWTEIYIPDYGWIPYDFTPPSNEEDVVSDFSFSSLLGALIMSGTNDTQNPASASENAAGDIENTFKFNFDLSLGFIIYPLIIAVIAAFLAIFFGAYYKELILSVRKMKYEKSGNYSAALKQAFMLYNEKYVRRHKCVKYPTVEEFSDLLVSSGQNELISPNDSADFVALANKAIYSKSTTTKEEYLHFISLIKKLTM